MTTICGMEWEENKNRVSPYVKSSLHIAILIGRTEHILLKRRIIDEESDFEKIKKYIFVEFGS